MVCDTLTAHRMEVSTKKCNCAASTPLLGSLIEAGLATASGQVAVTLLAPPTESMGRVVELLKAKLGLSDRVAQSIRSVCCTLNSQISSVRSVR